MSANDVLAWQICTGCANTRELLVTLDEAKRLQALPIAEQEQHDGCYPRSGSTRSSRWLTNGARRAPSQTSTSVCAPPTDRAPSVVHTAPGLLEPVWTALAAGAARTGHLRDSDHDVARCVASNALAALHIAGYAVVRATTTGGPDDGS